ncbi:MAG TPA: hypothetical protein VGC66_20930 [Pyrinomonadaceae bacterium]|jgi:hypothetical protein
MKEVKGFVVFPSSTEYHATKETRFTYHSSTHGKVKGLALNSLCGAYVGNVPYRGGVYPNGEPMTRFYKDVPVGFDFCRTCERLMTKRRRWRLFLSQFFRRRKSFNPSVKVVGS